MSPRIKRIRKVLSPPIIKGFKPYGNDSNREKLDTVVLLFEEYEALRLCDYDFYNHFSASEIMDVSRPTFTRIYASARKKIAQALVEGRQITIEGGKVYFDSDWYQCKTCKCFFNNPEKQNQIQACPLCRSSLIDKFDIEYISEADKNESFIDICICTQCGYEETHQLGRPCSQQPCPKCGFLMKRKGTPNCRILKK